MLIELMPVIVKTLLPSGTYEEHAKLQEAFEIRTLQEKYYRFTNKKAGELNSEES